MIRVSISVVGGGSVDYAEAPALLDIISAIVPPTTFDFRFGNGGLDDPFVVDGVRNFTAEDYAYPTSSFGGITLTNLTFNAAIRIVGDRFTVLSGDLGTVLFETADGAEILVIFTQPPESGDTFGVPLIPGASIASMIAAAGGLEAVDFFSALENLGAGLAFDGTDQDDDRLLGGRGSDTLAGGLGSDFVQGVQTVDLPGFPGGETRSDELFATERFARQDAFGLNFRVEEATEESPDNFLIGGPGNDLLFGVSETQHSTDILSGGPGQDHFYIDNGDVIEEWTQYAAIPENFQAEALENGEIIDYYITEKNVDNLVVNFFANEEAIFITPFRARGANEPDDVEGGLLGGFAIERGNLQEDLFDVSVIPLDGNVEGNVEAVLRFTYGTPGNFLAESLAARFAKLVTNAGFVEDILNEGQSSIDKAVAGYARTKVEGAISGLLGDDAAKVVSRVVFEAILPSTFQDNVVVDQIAETLSQDPNILESLGEFDVLGRALTELQNPYLVEILDPKNAESGPPPISAEQVVTDLLNEAARQAEAFLAKEANGLVAVDELKLGAELVSAIWLAYAQLQLEQQRFENDNALSFQVPVAENETGGQSYFVGGDDDGGPLERPTPSSLEANGRQAQQPSTPGTSALDRVYTDGDFDLSGTQVEDLIHTGDAPAVLTGNELNNVIASDGGNDTISGLGGDDTLSGGAGGDNLDGGDDEDTASYAGAEAAVAASLEDGTGTAGDAEGDTFVSIEHLEGSVFDDSLAGDSGRNKLEGDAGADDLSGGGGADTLMGGVGADSLNGDGGADNLMGGFGEDELSGGGGVDEFSGTLEELDGDTITDLEAGEVIDVEDAAFDRDALTVSTGSAILDIDVDGDEQSDATITAEGDFLAGDFMAVADGVGTAISFETFLPQLIDEQAVDPELINGIINEAFLRGDGATAFEVTLSDLAAASFQNVLGAYEVDTDGAIIDARIIVANTKTDKTANAVIDGVEAGHQVGFFLVQNAADWAASLSPGDEISFVDSAGASATRSSDEARLAVNGSTVDEITFHSIEAGLNPEDVQHALSGVAPGGKVINVGFEDLVGGGDQDYQDVIFTVARIEEPLA